jgi:hypothetical protein
MTISIVSAGPADARIKAAPLLLSKSRKEAERLLFLLVKNKMENVARLSVDLTAFGPYFFNGIIIFNN